jgi:hypothetical protein
MSRRNKPANRFGCKPDQDVCVKHDRPLECRHGCLEAAPHVCKDREIDTRGAALEEAARVCDRSLIPFAHELASAIRKLKGKEKSSA